MQYIRAVDRASLNKKLIDALEKLPNVKLFFNHKLTGADFNRNIAWFQPRRDDAKAKPSDRRSEEIEISFDLLIGADGAHSATRNHLMRATRMTYQQEYIDTLWCEFEIPAGEEGVWKISPGHLHIWPGSEHMFIAIPSKVS
jgi:kynurenine 3-monooxygenase